MSAVGRKSASSNFGFLALNLLCYKESFVLLMCCERVILEV